MNIGKKLPSFKARETAMGCVIDAIDPHENTHQLLGVYVSRRHVQRAISRLRQTRYSEWVPAPLHPAPNANGPF
jgi:hypothetical protein